jgi:hypothetical protein
MQWYVVVTLVFVGFVSRGPADLHTIMCFGMRTSSQQTVCSPWQTTSATRMFVCPLNKKYSSCMIIKFQCILMGSNNTFLFVTGMRGALDQSLLVSTSQSVEPGMLVYFWAQNAASFANNEEAIQYFWAHYSFLYVCAVPPAYYAHLAAFRARFYMEPEASDSGSLTSGPVPAAGRSTGTSMSTRTNRVAVSGSVRPLPPLKENVKKVMFYCWCLLGKTWCNWPHLCEGKKDSFFQWQCRWTGPASSKLS